MTCEKHLDLIDDLIEGELEGQIAEQMNSHVFACSECLDHYETLRREKEIYAHFLFDAEPPKSLRTNFQIRLEAEKEKTLRAAEKPAKAAAQRTDILGFLRLSPIWAAALLVAFGIGFGWLRFARVETGGDEYVAQTKPENLQSAAVNDKINENGKADSFVKAESGKNITSPKNNKPLVKTESAKASDAFARGESFAAETVKVAQKTVSERAKKIATRKIKLGEEQETKEKRLQSASIGNLEKEIAGQVEKIELLMRSFRNARAAESVGAFDVEYEKGQARQLLEKNARLRRDAENYGISDAEELLGRVEPYLLDIANLERNPPNDKVLDIKERISNQSIIASLQVY